MRFFLDTCLINSGCIPSGSAVLPLFKDSIIFSTCLRVRVLFQPVRHLLLFGYFNGTLVSLSVGFRSIFDLCMLIVICEPFFFQHSSRFKVSCYSHMLLYTCTCMLEFIIFSLTVNVLTYLFYGSYFSEFFTSTVFIRFNTLIHKEKNLLNIKIIRI